MTQEEKLETKERIVKIASELFSRFGFEGTSIRDIASQSGVNVASINYHFGSKHNLYWATVDEKHDWLDTGLKELADQNDDIVDVIVQGFKMLISDPAAIRTAMKMMLTEGVPDPEGDLGEKMMGQMGPPGAAHIRSALIKNLPEGVSEKALQWGVKSLFAGLIHWAMMVSSCKFEMMQQSQPEAFGNDSLENILRHHTKSVLAYIESNPSLDD